MLKNNNPDNKVILQRFNEMREKNPLRIVISRKGVFEMQTRKTRIK